jgi:UDP:flavonoid glycosyltransferase YjiC (YdhE family)
VPAPGQSPRDIWNDLSAKAAARPTRWNRLHTVFSLLRTQCPDESSLKFLVYACKDSDALVFSHASFYASIVAEHLDLPSVAAYLYPVIPSAAYPPMICPIRTLHVGLLHRLLHLLVDTAFWYSDRPWVNAWRTTQLALPPLALVPSVSQTVHSKSLILNGFSPSVTLRPKDWPTNAYITGYWYLDDGRSFTPQLALDSFLHSGPAPVCVTFGSEVGPRTSQTLRTVLRGLRSCGLRAIVIAGWMSQGDMPSDTDIFFADSASYEWLFPRVRCVIHHSGSGTAAEVLRAGVPSICIPFHGEQRYWADRLHVLGVAPRPLDYRRLSEDNVSSALLDATPGSRISARAQELGRQIRDETGIVSAIAHIYRFLDITSDPNVTS